MKKTRSISIPERLPKVSRNKSHYEQRLKKNLVSLSIKSSPQVFLLFKENLELRNRLKLFNEKLQHLVYKESKTPIKKKNSQKLDSDQSLLFVKKNLEYYKNEFNRIKARQKQLSDPGYEAQLMLETDKQKQKLAEYEDRLKKSEAKQKLREKSLNTILETGEMAELHKEFNEYNTEISFYTKKVLSLEKLNSQTLSSYQDILNKAQEFSKEFELLRDKAGDYNNSKPKELQDRLEKLNKKLNIALIGNRSKEKVLNNKVKQLEEDLEYFRKNEDELSEKIEKLVREHRKHDGLLTDFTSRGYSQRKRLADDFMDSELVFITKSFN